MRNIFWQEAQEGLFREITMTGPDVGARHVGEETSPELLFFFLHLEKKSRHLQLICTEDYGQILIFWETDKMGLKVKRQTRDLGGFGRV